MGFWRRPKAPQGVTAVVGLARGDSLHVRRGTRNILDGSVVVRGDAVLRLDDLDTVAELLRERLGWQEEEPVYLAGPSPLLVGSALSVTVPRHEEGHAMVRDTREILHEARWRAVDKVREEAAAYFGCSLEDIGAFETSVEHWRETAAGVAVTIFQICLPRWGVARTLHLPATLPRSDAVTVPLLLADGVGTNDGSEAVLHVEDECTVFAVRRANLLRHVRTLRLGMAAVRSHIEETLGCSPREAERLLAFAPAGKFSLSNQRILERILRQVLPLFSGMLQVLASGCSPADCPRRLLVTGIFPHLTAKYFCRPQILSRSFGGSCRVDLLPDDLGDISGLSPMLQTMLLSVTQQREASTQRPRVSLRVPASPANAGRVGGSGVLARV